MSSSTSTSCVGLGHHILPSLFSPAVSFHPSHNGSSARNSFIFETVFGTIEGLLLVAYAGPCVRFIASPSMYPPSEPLPQIAVSLFQIVGGCIIGLHLPLFLGIPNRRTNVEGRLILQANFEIVEWIAAAMFGLLALKGEQVTGLRSDRMAFFSGLVAFFGVVRGWMAFTKEGWAGAYVEEGETVGKKGQ
ncbi:hypothetical protein NA57DRAFT_55836 [Rhizodiscina lignyota]|uniref:Uncharacterized protein n=1 Tax=Rhizodiscina lignyota TaxID=1504668 RepID=A0A9P4IH44_9PEZI|nr:hypothetical protein NA57DRAFT_55836 [Rhizodiscina lignyota]